MKANPDKFHLLLSKNFEADIKKNRISNKKIEKLRCNI